MAMSKREPQVCFCHMYSSITVVRGVSMEIRMSALAVAVGEQQGWDEERNRPRTGMRGLEYCLRCMA
jgi:hypothetical protein